MKLPFSFNLNLVFRMLLPGLFFALGLLPILQSVMDKIGAANHTEAAFVILVIFGGWLIVILDMHIYMVYEGRRYWPLAIQKFFVKRQKLHLNKLNEIIEEYRKNKVDYQRYQEAYVELRQYPVDKDWNYTVIYPTRLGNLLTSFETYPEYIYGMPATFYWPRLSLVLDKEQREEISNIQALADSTLYTSAALYFCGLMCFAYSIIMSLNLRWIDYLPSASVLWFLCFLSSLSGWLVYRGSFHLHAKFGEYFKAVFDVHFDKVFFKDILEQLKEYGSFAANENIPKWQKYWEISRFLVYYRVKLANGKLVSKTEALEDKYEASNKGSG